MTPREARPLPRPWKVAQPWAGFSEIRSADGKLVFGLAVGDKDERQPSEVCEANAALLESSVNSHDELVLALEDLREAATEAYKTGRIAAEPFVRAGNVLAALSAAKRGRR